MTEDYATAWNMEAVSSAVSGSFRPLTFEQRTNGITWFNKGLAVGLTWFETVAPTEKVLQARMSRNHVAHG